MKTIIRLKVSELNFDLIKRIKSAFRKEQEIEIRIRPIPGEDETAYLLSTAANRKILKKSLAEAKLIKELKGSVKKVALSKQGKIKLQSASDFLNAL